MVKIDVMRKSIDCVCAKCQLSMYDNKLKYNLYPLFAEEIEHTTDVVDRYKKSITQSLASGSHYSHRRWWKYRSSTLETTQ